MSCWRNNVSVLLVLAYALVTTGGPLRLLIPSSGDGVPSLQQQRGDPREPSRPIWIPRRHLPMIKLVSLDQILACVRLVSPAREISRPLVSAADSVVEGQFSLPASPRAPPAVRLFA